MGPLKPHTCEVKLQTPMNRIGLIKAITQHDCVYRCRVKNKGYHLVLGTNFALGVPRYPFILSMELMDYLLNIGKYTRQTLLPE